MKRPSAIRMAHLAGTALLCLVLAGYWIYVDWLRPFPSHLSRYDPQMPYLLNSLAIFKSQPYMYYDHPGTPLEVMGTFLLAAMRFFAGASSEDYWVMILREPEGFLRLAHGLLTLGSLVCVVLICQKATKIGGWGDLTVAFAAASAFFGFFPPLAFGTLAIWSHNSFNFAAGTLLLVLLLIRLRSGKPLEAWEAWSFGIGAGALTSVQLYFGTWVIGILIALVSFVILEERARLKPLWTAIRVLIGAMLGFLLATGPILHKYRELSWWVRRLILHQGRYGGGPGGVTSIGQLAENLEGLWREGSRPLTLMGLSMLLLLAAMVVKRTRRLEARGWWAMSVAMSAQIILAFLLVAKHPGGTYLMSLVAVSPIVLLLSLDILGRVQRGLAMAVSLTVLGAFLQGFGQSLQGHEQTREYFMGLESEIQDQIGRIAEEEEKAPELVAVLWGYGAPSHCYALRFGDVYTGGLFRREIDELCPKEWMFDVWSEKAVLPSGVASLHESSEWDVLVVPAAFAPSMRAGVGEIVASQDGSLLFLLPLTPGQ